MFRALQKICLKHFTSDSCKVLPVRKWSYTIGASKNQKQTNYIPKIPVISSRRMSQTVILGGFMAAFGLTQKDEEIEPELITLIKRSILLIEREEFQKAEEMLHIALKMAQDQRNEEGITYIFDVMANLAYDTGNFVKARKLFINVMQRLVASGAQPDDNRLIHICLKIANIHHRYREMPEAEDGYIFCVDTLEEKVMKGDHSKNTLLLWAMCLDWYSHFLQENKRHKESLNCLEKAIDAAIKVHGKVHDQVVIFLNDLATLNNLLGHTDRAVEYLNEAIQIANQLPDRRYIETAYVNLALIYKAKKMYRECENACLTAKKLAAKYGNSEVLKMADECLTDVRQAMRG